MHGRELSCRHLVAVQKLVFSQLYIKITYTKVAYDVRHCSSLSYMLQDASFAFGSESASYSVRAMVPFSAAFQCKFAQGDWDLNLGRKA